MANPARRRVCDPGNSLRPLAAQHSRLFVVEPFVVLLEKQAALWGICAAGEPPWRKGIPSNRTKIVVKDNRLNSVTYISATRSLPQRRIIAEIAEATEYRVARFRIIDRLWRGNRPV